MLTPGDPVPWVKLRRLGGGFTHLAAMAGKPVVVTYLVSGGHPAAPTLLKSFIDLHDLFDGECALHLIVTCDPADEDQDRLGSERDGTVRITDFDGAFAKALGLLPQTDAEYVDIQAVTFVLDKDLRVHATVPITGEHHAAQVRAALPVSNDLPLRAPQGIAPVLVIPRVLEPDLCQRLIAHYDVGKPMSSGVVVNRPSGKTEVVVDADRKTRRDLPLRDEPLVRAVHERVIRRIVPELRKAFQFHAAHVERYVIACYLAEERGWFGPHRDNQGPATAHRKFACTMNLNAEDYEGGDLHFPEFGATRYRAPTGGAVLFSCSLLHAVDPVTSGRRLCVLPFLYDEDGMRIREQNYRRTPRR